MDWKKSAIEDLRNYPLQKESLQNIPERLAALKEKYESVRCVTSDATPVMGGTSRTEENMLDNILERERLKHTYHAAKRIVRLVERGLSNLEDKERRVLEQFYMNRGRSHVERLCEELGYEQAQVYRVKDAALHKFTLSMYGLTKY